MLAEKDITNATLSPEPMPPKGTGLSGRIILPAEFPELKLFALLKWKFSHPNGPLTFLGKPGGDPDAPIKWDFLFVPAEPLRLQVIRNASGIEVWWWGAPTTEAEIMEYLGQNIERHTDAIELSVATLEQYTLILNPYVRHKAIVRLADEELSRMSVGRSPNLETIASKEAIQEFTASYRIFMEAVQRQASLMLLLVMESAFMAEAYLNLLLAFLIRDEIRASKVIMDETLLRKWRAKIERLHVDCKHFPNAANLGDARIRDAKTMFDIRNKVAHSFPDKQAMAIGTMWFQNSFPVFEKAVPFHHFAIARHNQLPSLEEAKFCKAAAERLIEFLLELVDEKVRKEFQFATQANPLGYNETKNQYGVPFGEAVIMFLALTKQA